MDQQERIKKIEQENIQRFHQKLVFDQMLRQQAMSMVRN